MNETQRHTNLDRQATRARAARPRRRNSRPAATARRAAATLLALGLLAQLFAAGGVDVRTARAQTKTARAQGEIEIEGAATQPTATATVNFAELAAQNSVPGKDAFAAHGAAAEQIEPPPAPPEPESELKPATVPPALKSPARASKSGAASVKSAGDASASGDASAPATASAIGDESRPPASSFDAQTDAGTHAPPNAAGAVGFERTVSIHNSNYVVQDKATGAVMSSVPVESFWSATGASGVFNPRAIFDRNSNRFILAAVSNARSGSSSVLLAVSGDGDNFQLSRFDADEFDLLWADYPSLGVSANYIAVTVNLHRNSDNVFAEGMVLAVPYTTGTPAPTIFRGITSNLGGFSMQPAVTYVFPGDGIGYFVSHINSGAGTYRVSRLEWTPDGPALTIGNQKLNGLGGWTQPGGETLPQAGGPRKIDAPDSRVQKAVVRNGSIYFCQTVGLPAGRTAATIDRTAAQWVRLDSNADFVEGGRVEDPTATPTNGGKWYAYPSLSVNRLGDVLLGFNEFSSAQFASAAYAYRTYDDPAGTMRLPHVYKAGVGYYERLSPANRNLWGLHSSAQTDVNHLDIWTLQEYAAAPAGAGSTSGRWGTWWAKVTPPSADRIAFVSNRDGNDEIYTMEADGSHVRRITFNPTQDTSPTWSPDRTRIAFTRDGPTGEQIYVVNADGSNETFLTQGREPAWSPDPDYIAFVRGSNIWTHMVGDGWEQNVTNNEAEDGYYGIWRFYGYYGDSAPSWSPDGQTIVFAGQLEDSTYIFTINPWNPGQRTEIMRNEFGWLGDPAWSPDGPDGQRIAYVDAGHICIMSPEGDEGPCTNAYYRDYAPSWSPDGSKLIFHTNRTGNEEVFTMHPDLIDPVNLTNSPASHENTPGG